MIKGYSAYLKDNPKGYWFKARLFGWGWTPAKWQGWLVLILFLMYVFLISAGISMDQLESDAVVPFSYYVKLWGAIVVLIVICYWKGEKPKWQWGIPSKFTK